MDCVGKVVHQVLVKEELSVEAHRRCVEVSSSKLTIGRFLFEASLILFLCTKAPS